MKKVTKEYSCKCVMCGKKFVSHSKKANICSKSCRWERYKGKYKKEYIVSCNYCNKEIKRILDHSPKEGETFYCDQECSGRRKNEDGTGEFPKCRQCGNEFKQKHARHFFCSTKCKGIYTAERAIKVETECSFCGKKIERRRCLIGKQNFFCSRKCEADFRISKSEEVRKCEICKKDFDCKKISKSRFCSMECQSEWQKTLVGKLSASYLHEITDEMRSIECDYCGKKFVVSPKEIETRKCCSRSCAVKMIGKTDTLPHRIAKEIMEEIYVEYIPEFPIKRFLADIYICESNLIIEINGTYWHSDIRVYPVPERDEREKGIEKDKRKKDILNKLEYKILYLWEKDLYENRELCKKLITRYLERNGILENYHSMNYHTGVFGELLINNNLLIPHAER